MSAGEEEEGGKSKRGGGQRVEGSAEMGDVHLSRGILLFPERLRWWEG